MTTAENTNVDTTALSVDECAACGAALLDRVIPDWYRQVDSTNLDVQDTDTCVLAQLYGSYNAGVLSLFGSYRLIHQAEHGFDGAAVADCGDYNDIDIDLDAFFLDVESLNRQLSVAWVVEIHKRRECTS